MPRSTAEDDYERYKMRLDAEVGLAASSAFFCGVSLDMLSETELSAGETKEWIMWPVKPAAFVCSGSAVLPTNLRARSLTGPDVSRSLLWPRAASIA